MMWIKVVGKLEILKSANRNKIPFDLPVELMSLSYWVCIAAANSDAIPR